jgi:DNA polymerase-2
MGEILTGWLLDMYADETAITLWLLEEHGQRRKLTHAFPASFYAAGPSDQLRSLWLRLSNQDIPVHLSRTERKDVFQGMVTVLSVEVTHAPQLDTLFRRVVDVFPDLTYYDSDISLSLRYAAEYGVFPLAHCRVEVQDDKIMNIAPLDTPWDLEPDPAPLRILSLEPDRDPAQGRPRHIVVSYEKVRYILPLEPVRALLISLRSTLERYDPDLLLTDWGDTWLLPHLIKLSQENNLPLPLNRTDSQDVVEHKARTYFSYGQIVYKGSQVQLHGRLHLDRHNAMMWSDYGLEGVLEMARVTALPIQDAARLSPGTGISSMQFVTALRAGILIPWHKHQAETPKTALDLIRSDMGGLVYQPTIGLHKNVGGIDFVSMYPGIMVQFNISPEVPRSRDGDLTPAPGEPGKVPSMGIVPQTLAPLLKKRIALKTTLSSLHPKDCRREAYKARSSAEKWLLVTCFGYLGYKNARFGRIEAHEAVTAYGREALLRAKEAAEDLGFEILHMYVDGLWVQRPDCTQSEDFQSLLADVSERTGIPIALDGIYRWVVFLPSRVDERIPVPNRYFGVFQDGSIKVRGIEARRHDTPPFIAGTQMGIFDILAKAPDADRLPDFLPEVRRYVKLRLDYLLKGRVPLEELLVSQRLSRELNEYSSPSPAARAVWQLQAEGKQVSPGQRVRFLYTRGNPGVQAWYAASLPHDFRLVDTRRYQALLRRAVDTIVNPIEQHFGILAEETPYRLFPINVSDGWVRGTPNRLAMDNLSQIDLRRKERKEEIWQT